MNAAVYFVTQNAADLADESLKNNIGLKFAFRSTDIVEIKKTLEFFGLDPEDEGNQKRLRNLENGQCLMQAYTGMWASCSSIRCLRISCMGLTQSRR